MILGNPNYREDMIGNPEQLLEELERVEIKVSEFRNELKDSLSEALLR